MGVFLFIGSVALYSVRNSLGVAKFRNLTGSYRSATPFIGTGTRPHTTKTITGTRPYTTKTITGTRPHTTKTITGISPTLQKKGGGR